MFGDIGAMMEAAKSVDFDKLSKLPDQIDRLIEAVEVGNMVMAMLVSDRYATTTGHPADLNSVVASARDVVQGHDGRG